MGERGNTTALRIYKIILRILRSDCSLEYTICLEIHNSEYFLQEINWIFELEVCVYHCGLLSADECYLNE